VGLSF